ncbi:hypothetical protein LTR86_009634 [Recurvomyces mirabilis]|nr:hypothetical protein LTR86_009634 [Recurvomyces mirabilis]
MRLLNVHTLKFEVFYGERPRYVTASHRWKAGEEAMLQDIERQEKTETSGYKKVMGFAEYVRDHVEGVDWLWVDTCCVKQDSERDVSEAVNSMFQWYADAELCLAYLFDVHDPGNLDAFVESVWFERGWTLQELLAPRTVLFLTSDWRVIGHKSGDENSEEYHIQELGPCLISCIASRTQISENVLKDYSQSKSLTTEEKLAWTAHRETARPEDMYYSLLGIFDVRMRLDYSEGRASARDRLMKYIAKRSRRPEELEKVVRWLDPPDPWSNHTSARDRYESGTGEWLLRGQQYRDWKSGVTRHLGLYGKAGSGKTVLFSTVVEDIREHCRARPEMAYTVFYFTFSDRGKQTWDKVLLSLVAQLVDCDDVLSRLSDAARRGAPRREDLETVLVTALSTHSEAYLLLDALDEITDEEGIRHLVLDKLLWLSRQAPSCKILATSRESQDIYRSGEALGAVCVTLDEEAVNSDIQLFRWAYCQMQNIINLKSTKQSHLTNVLKELPMTLDGTYTRMLESISLRLRKDAVALLQWIAYSEHPMTLAELAEATIVDPSGQGAVDVADRGDIHDVVDLLEGLVTIIYYDDSVIFASNGSTESQKIIHRKLQPRDQLRFAHFSVKEFLESPRLLLIGGGLSEFQLESARGHRFLAQSCLTYLLWYIAEQSMMHRDSCEEVDIHVVRRNLPLLYYSADAWPYHSYRQSAGSLERELRLLTNQDSMMTWFEAGLQHSPERHEFSVSGLCYASYFGLLEIADTLIRHGEDLGAPNGHLARALRAAAVGGHERIVERLLAAGADVNAQGGGYRGTALQAASFGGHTMIVKRLLAVGADVNTIVAETEGTALVAASRYGHEDIVQILLQHGADVNAQGGRAGNALRAAAARGHVQIMLRLLDAGADVGAHILELGSALGAASRWGHLGAIRLLLARGADASLEDAYGRTAMYQATYHGHIAALSMLSHAWEVQNNHDVDGYGALMWTAMGARTSLVEEIVHSVDDGLPDVGELGHPDKLGCSSLHHLATAVHDRGLHGVNMVLKAGVSPDLADSQGWTALHWAAHAGNTDVIRALIDAGAKSDLSDNRGWTAYVLARFNGHEDALEALTPSVTDKGGGVVVVNCPVAGMPTIAWHVKTTTYVSAATGASKVSIHSTTSSNMSEYADVVEQNFKTADASA